MLSLCFLVAVGSSTRLFSNTLTEDFRFLFFSARCFQFNSKLEKQFKYCFFMKSEPIHAIIPFPYVVWWWRNNLDRIKVYAAIAYAALTGNYCLKPEWDSAMEELWKTSIEKLLES